jgi:repressor LexA
MKPLGLRKARQALGLTQKQLAEKLGTIRLTITRYESGTRRIPSLVDVAINQLSNSTMIQMAGIVAAGRPIEALVQSEIVEVPRSMLSQGPGGHFALRVKGDSMRDEGILPGDLVIVHKQVLARNGQTVIALVNHEATIKKYYRRGNRIELVPANSTMRPITVTERDDFRIEGVVVGVMRHLR